MKNIEKPMGAVIFYGVKVPVVWERETSKYVFNIKRLILQDGVWQPRTRNFEDKMDKEEIVDFN